MQIVPTSVKIEAKVTGLKSCERIALFKHWTEQNPVNNPLLSSATAM